VRQWVLRFPFQLRFLFASRPEIMGRVLGTRRGRRVRRQQCGRSHEEVYSDQFYMSDYSTFLPFPGIS
jgi:hypothetical protein